MAFTCLEEVSETRISPPDDIPNKKNLHNFKTNILKFVQKIINLIVLFNIN